MHDVSRGILLQIFFLTLVKKCFVNAPRSWGNSKLVNRETVKFLDRGKRVKQGGVKKVTCRDSEFYTEIFPVQEIRKNDGMHIYVYILTVYIYMITC